LLLEDRINSQKSKQTYWNVVELLLECCRIVSSSTKAKPNRHLVEQATNHWFWQAESYVLSISQVHATGLQDSPNTLKVARCKINP